MSVQVWLNSTNPFWTECRQEAMLTPIFQFCLGLLMTLKIRTHLNSYPHYMMNLCKSGQNLSNPQEIECRKKLMLTHKWCVSASLDRIHQSLQEIRVQVRADISRSAPNPPPPPLLQSKCVCVWLLGGGGVNVLKFQTLFLFCPQKLLAIKVDLIICLQEKQMGKTLIKLLLIWVCPVFIGRQLLFKILKVY